MVLLQVSVLQERHTKSHLGRSSLCIIIDMMYCNDIDGSTLHNLDELHASQNKQFYLLFANVRPQIMEVLRAGGIYQKFGEKSFFNSVEDALQVAKVGIYLGNKLIFGCL
jgi:hypothetical protein